MEKEIRPIDCWDSDCKCSLCEDLRKEWLEDEYNKRALKWLEKYGKR